MPVCTKCGETRPRTAFDKDKRRKSGLRFPCKLCRRAYYNANRERIAAVRKKRYNATREDAAVYSKQWKAGHPFECRLSDWIERSLTRVAAVGGRVDRVTTDQLRAHLARTRTCAWCGEVLDLGVEYPHPDQVQIDHVEEVADGGSHSLDNFQFLHAKCNKAKAAKARARRQHTKIAI